jgi:uncharacterized CHY-type Zn-finger protein
MGELILYEDLVKKRDEDVISEFKMDERSECYHPIKTLNAEARIIICKKCDTYLDLFDCLQEIVNDRERSERRKKRLNKEIEDMKLLFVLSKKELASLDQKIKRRKEKLNPI